MAVALSQRSRAGISIEKTEAHIWERPHELVAFCPRCKAMETLAFVSGRLIHTRKFNQNDGHVYHDCGSAQPCRLYRSF